MSDTFDAKDRSSEIEDVDLVKNLENGSARTSWNGVEFTPNDAKSARRRVDFILVSTLTLYYFMSYLDRSNLGNAKVAGIEKDLGMTGNDYNIAISVYFVPYILLEYPATIFLKRAGPDRMLPLLVALWGIVTLCQGFVHQKGALLACRFLLGALESGLTPCSVVLMSMFVRRFDLQKRIATFFAMISLAGAFSGLLAYAITKNLSGQHGYAGWRWIFMIEGAATVGVSLLTFWLMPRSPTTAWWLSETQRAALLAGLQDDNTAYVEAKDETGLTEGLKVFWTNPVVPVYLCMNAASGFFVNGLPYFIPPIIKGLGYTSVQAQLHTVPPYALAFCVAIVTSVIGDWTRMRTPMLSLGGFIGLIGYIVQFSRSTTAYSLGYVALFFIVGGSGALASSVSAWGLGNTSGHVRRATTIAGGFMCSNGIGLASVWAFRANQAPAYYTGSCLGLAAAIALAVVPPVAALNLRRINRKRDREMEGLATGFVHVEGVIDDRDVRFRFCY